MCGVISRARYAACLKSRRSDVRKLLNTLYVTTQGAYLAKDGETVAVRTDGEVRLALPIHTLEGIICFGQVSCSPFLLGHCAEHGVSVSWLTEHGRFLARAVGPVSGNVLLRRRQYRAADDEVQASGIARNIVAAKVANARSFLLRGAREREGDGATALRQAGERMAPIAERALKANDREQVRGIEGDAARAYFSAFNHMITEDKVSFTFRERSRRPPLDRVNALLSFIYTLLMHDLVGALESVGLDPQVGYLHTERPGRPSLALDLMEEFRAVVADRFVVALINRKQVRAGGFAVTDTGAVEMEAATRKDVLSAWQRRKADEIMHPFLNEKIAVGLLPYAQALLLSRYLRGDVPEYPPYLWK
jgi:CRISPR-associated protein Cas1